MANAKEETSPEHINLKVMGQDGNIVQFKIKKHTGLKKLMSTYCERAGLALQTIRFSFDGTRINEGDTPKSLDMEDGDTIEVFQQQSGGGCCSVPLSPQPTLPLQLLILQLSYSTTSAAIGYSNNPNNNTTTQQKQSIHILHC